MVKNALHKKLWRDMLHARMQFAALMLLCVLGTFLFAGIDGIAQMAAATNNAYFTHNRLADFFITLPAADREALARVRALPGVEDVCARFSLDLESTLPGEPLVNVTAYDGAMTINIPLIDTGEALSPGDLRGCLVQAGFADANHLRVDDPVTVRYAQDEYTFFVRGVIYSPEFISVANGVASKPEEYGYILINARALSQIPLTQLIVKCADGMDAASLRDALHAALPTAFILDRSAHRSTAVAQDNESMFRSLSLVFPLAAFVVAALIVMTTLTRMIDNERMQLGTLRALGYSSGRIKRHYLSYAVLPSMAGSLLGALIGHFTLPPLVWALLIGQNEYPYRIDPPISPAALCMVAFSVFMSAAICLITYQRTARESTASLLRAKPPKDGKRILLERITPLWRRMHFNQKMIVRNLFRSKLRTLMSCVGLLCCNALLIASMGIQDSVNATVYNHYERTLSYDVRADLNAQAGTAQSYQGRLEAEAVECIMETSASLSAGGYSRTGLVTVTQDEQQLLRLGKGETLVPFAPGTVAVTEKIASLLHVKPGERLTLRLPGDDQSFTLPVSQIVFNNFSQGVYMARSTWLSLRKGAFTPTAILLKNPTAAALSSLEDMDEVREVHHAQDEISDALISLETVSSIFLLLMVIALALAFVICYNMGLINFSERTREYATLKVLGYHQREIRRLILHENTLITVIALVFSVLPGLFFTDAILSVCQTDSVIYLAQVSPGTVLLSSVITFLFSGLIQRLLVLKVRTIVMVEALKSVE